MQREAPRSRGGSGSPSPTLSFDQPLEREDDVLDTMVSLLGRGQLPEGAWEELHAAAERDGRLSELAFAYDAFAQGKRIKALPASVVAEVFYEAGAFALQRLGDAVGAAAYFRRALGAAPAHGAAFEALANTLEQSGDDKGLAALHAEAAHHKPRHEQLTHLRKAAELFDRTGEAEKAIELLQQILRLDPQDDAARSSLEARYLKANRVRDVVRLLEQALSNEPPPDEDRATSIRARLIDLYASQLHEPERSLPHVEAFLAVRPADEDARRVAEKLLATKGLAARAAAALAGANEAIGRFGEVVRYLTIELEHTRGPKRRDVLRKLGVLRQERLRDLPGAFEAFEQALAIDPTEDELRARYAQAARALDKPLDAARTLGRVAPVVKDPALKARISSELAELLLAGGDAKRARAAFLQVLATAEADAPSVARSARALAEMHEADGDTRALADVLGRLVEVEEDAQVRQKANERLAELAETVLGDRARAITAYRGLASVDDAEVRSRALLSLERLYEATGDRAELASVLEQRAREQSSLADAQKLDVRAAKVLTEAGETSKASASWRRIVERYGATREALAHWIPVLEAERNWSELSLALTSDAHLAPDSERAPILAQLANVLQTRLRDVDGAIDAHRRVLELDPADKTSRAALEKFLATAEHRLRAARALEPFYRAQGIDAGLLRVLDAKATLADDPAERLRALEETRQIAEAAGDALRALEAVGRALAEAVANDWAYEPWLSHVERLAASGVDPQRKAQIYARALGDRVVDSPALSSLARRTGEAHAECGDVGLALDAYRRALAYEPSKPELVERIDELLRDQGSPGERIALHRAALERQTDVLRQKAILSTIASIQRKDERDDAAAIATYLEILALDAADRDAYRALAELYRARENWAQLIELWEAELTHLAGDDAKHRRAELAEACAMYGDPERAATHARTLLAEAELAPAELDSLAKVATVLEFAWLSAEVLRRRAALASDPLEQVRWLERLGELEATSNEAAGGADPVETFRKAARLAESAGDDDLARRLYLRMRDLREDDADAAERLVELFGRSGDARPIPALLVTLLAHAKDRDVIVGIELQRAHVLEGALGDVKGALAPAEHAFELAPQDDIVLETYERIAVSLGEHRRFGDTVSRVLSTEQGGSVPIAAEKQRELARARARVLGMDPALDAEATAAFEALLHDNAAPESERRLAADAFAAVLATRADGPELRDAMRSLSAFRVAHAEDAGKVGELAAWATLEEGRFGELERALTLHRRILEIDPEHQDALAAEARLSLALGRVDEALRALVARRDRSEGAARIALELELATLIVERTSEPSRALPHLAAILEAGPADGAALALATRLLADDATRAGAVALLDKAVDANEDPRVRAEVLKQLLHVSLPPAAKLAASEEAGEDDGEDDGEDEGTPKASAPPEQRRRWFGRLLDFYEESERKDLALETALDALSESMLDDELWDRAEGLVREIARPEPLAQLYELSLAKTTTPEEARRLGERAVAFFEEWFEDDSGVVRVLERVFSADPGDAWAFDRLKLHFNATEKWEPLFSLFDRAIAVASGEHRTELLEDAAQIAKDFAADADRAIGYLEELHRARPTDARLVTSLERLYERQGRSESLIALLTSELPRMPTAKAQTTRARIVGLWLDDVSDVERAFEMLEAILAHGAEAEGDTAVHGAHVGSDAAPDVVAMLERVLAKTRRHEPPTAETEASSVRQKAASLLRERYAAGERLEDLARVLEIQLEVVVAKPERVRRHLELGSLFERLGQDDKALDHYVALVLLAPEEKAHTSALATVAERAGRFDRLAEVLVAAADHAADEALSTELLLSAGLVSEERLGEAERAIELYLRVVTSPAASAASRLEAAVHLDPLLARFGRAIEQLDALELMAELHEEPAARRRALGAAAKLATDLGALDRAIAAWEACLGDDGEDLEALSGLVDLLSRRSDTRALVAVLARRAAVAASSETQRRADRVRIATLLAGPLEDAPAAIETFQAIERDFGEATDLTEALAPLLTREQRFRDLAELLARAAERETEPKTRAAYLERLGDLERGPLGEKERAIEHYERALADVTLSEKAIAGLTTLVLGAETRKAATAVLTRAYSGARAYGPLLELTEERLETADTDAARVAILEEAATLAEEHFDAIERAFGWIRRALLLSPESETLEAWLRRLASRASTHAAYAETLSDAIARLERGDRRDPDAALAASTHARRLRFQLGGVLEADLRDDATALARYLELTANDAGDADAAEAVVRVALRIGRFDELAQTVVRFAHATSSDASRYLETIEQSVSSAAAWSDITRAFTDAIAEAHASLGGGAGGGAAAPVFRDLEAKVARWHRDQRADDAAAEAAFLRALRHDTTNAALLSELAVLQRKTPGRPLVETLLALSATRDGDLALIREAAETAQRAASDRVLARSILGDLLHLASARWQKEEQEGPITAGSPDAPGPYAEWALDALLALATDEGDAERAIELLLEGAKLPFPRERSRGMRHRAADMAYEAQKDIERAVRLSQDLFEEDFGDDVAVKRLATIFEATADRTRLIALRRRQVDVESVPSARIALRLELATLHEGGGDPTQAIAVLRETLGEAPRERETTERLLNLLRCSNDPKALEATLLDQAERAEAERDLEEARRFFAEAAKVAELELGAPDAAIRHHERIVALGPDAAAHDALGRLYMGRADYARAAKHLEALRPLASHAERPEATLRLVDALSALGDEAAATRWLEIEAEASPAHDEVRERLAAVYRKAEAWRNLATLLAAAAQHAPNKATRFSRLTESADLYLERCGDADAAIPLLEQASDLEPSSQPTRLLLAQALGAAGRTEEARSLLRNLLEAYGARRPKERAAVHHQLAQLELRIGDRAGALLELDAATKIDPANAKILRSLAELARDDGQFDRAERSYRALLVVLPRESHDGTGVAARSEVLFELSELAQKQGDADRAAEVLESALEAATKSAYEAARLEAALRAHARHDLLARALEGRIDSVEDGKARALLHAELAELYAGPLGAEERALEALFAGLALDPTSLALHERAHTLATRLGKLAAYTAELEKGTNEARRAGDRALVATLQARLAEAVLAGGDDVRAAELLERALEEGGDERSILARLDGIYASLGRIEDQARTLTRLVELGEAGGAVEAAELGDEDWGDSAGEDVDGRGSHEAEDARADILYRLAALRLAARETLDEGCAWMEKAFAARVDVEQALALLSQALLLDARNGTVLALVERIAREHERPRALLDVLERRVRAGEVDRAVLAESVELANTVGEPAVAESILRIAVEKLEDAGPKDVLAAALAQLAEQRRAAGDRREAADLLAKAAEQAEPDEARRLAFEVARLAEGELEDLALAATTYERLLEREPTDRDAWEPLLDVYRRTGRHADLEKLLGAVTEFVESAEERSRLRFERVRVMIDALGAGDEAAEPLRDIVDEDPTQVEAAMLLGQILERQGREDDLVELLSKQLDAAKDRSDGSSVASLSLRLGALLERRDAMEARNAYYAGLDWEPTSAPLLRALRALLERDGDANERADVLERLLAVEKGPAAESLALELSALRAELWDEEGAERALELGFRGHPESATLRARLEAMYAERSAYAKLAELHRIGARARTEPLDKVERFREAARLFREKLGDFASAAASLEEALEARPRDLALLRDVIALKGEAGDPRGAEAVIDRALAQAEWRPEERGALLAARAGFRAALDRDEEALADLEEAHALGSADRLHVADQLERLEEQKWSRGDRDEARTLTLRWVGMVSGFDDRQDRAREKLIELLRADARDRDALRALAALEERAEDWDGASATYRRLVSLEEGDAVVDTALRLADACARAGRFGDARSGLERARAMAPENADLRARLEALYAETGAFRELADLQIADANAALDVAGRFGHLVRAGAILVEHAGDAEAATPLLEEAYTLRPGDFECAAVLADAYTLAGRLDAATDLITQAVAAHRGRRSRELSPLYHRLARVSRARGDRPSEMAWLSSALDMDAHNGPVASELAAVALEGGQLEVAVRALRAITMMKSPGPMTRAHAYHWLGHIAQQQGDVKRAVVMLKRAVDEDPSLDDARAMLDALSAEGA